LLKCRNDRDNLSRGNLFFKEGSIVKGRILESQPRSPRRIGYKSEGRYSRPAKFADVDDLQVDDDSRSPSRPSGKTTKGMGHPLEGKGRLAKMEKDPSRLPGRRLIKSKVKAVVKRRSTVNIGVEAFSPALNRHRSSQISAVRRQHQDLKIVKD